MSITPKSTKYIDKVHNERQLTWKILQEHETRVIDGADLTVDVVILL
jgi:hypothetical protein